MLHPFVFPFKGASQSIPHPTPPALPALPAPRAPAPDVPPFQEFLSHKLLAHVCSDFFIRDIGDLEGNTRAGSIHLMIDRLEKLPLEWKNDRVKSYLTELKRAWALAKMLEEGKDIQQIADIIFEDVKKLQAGERCFIPGGWTSMKSGHAMMYVVERQANAKLSLYVFNTGAGVRQFHSFQTDEKGYRRYITGERRVDIEEKDFLEPHRLMSLLDCVGACPIDDDKNILETIYDGILPTFGGKSAPPPPEITKAMKAQRAGTCTWKVLTAFLRHCVDDDVYKKLKIGIRIEMIEQYLKEHPAFTKRLDRWLNHDIEKLSRALVKQKKLFSPQEFDALHDRLQMLRALKQERLIDQTEKKPPVRLSPTDKRLNAQMPIPTLKLQESLQTQPGARTARTLGISTERPSKEKAAEHLERWADITEHLVSEQQYLEAVHAINHVIDNLPIPLEKDDPYWEAREHADIERTMQALVRLNETLLKACFHMRQVHHKERATAFITYTILEKLTEVYFGYKRDFQGRGLISLYQTFYHEIHILHIDHFSERAAFAHDAVLQERIKMAREFLVYGEKALQTFIDDLSRFRMYPPDATLTTMQKVQQEIQKKGEAKGVDRLLSEVLMSDFGQLDMAPPWLVALNKQTFLVSYFFTREVFEGNPAIPSAFSIGGESLEDIKERIKKENSWHFQPKVWVNGTCGRSENPAFSICVGDVLKKYLKQVTNKSLKELLENYVLAHRPLILLNPNKAIIERSSYPELAEEEAGELLTIMQAPDSIRLWMVLAFFAKDFDRLQKNDYRLLFEIMTQGCLEKETKKHRDKIRAFIFHGLQEMQDPAQIEGYLFLIRLGERVDPDYGWQSLLRERLTSSRDDVEKNALQAQLAHCLALHNNISAFDEILKGLNLIQSGKTPDSLATLSILRPIQEFLFRNAHLLKEKPEKHCHAMLPEAKAWKEIAFPLYESEDGAVQANLLSGTLTTSSAPNAFIPVEIRFDPYFIKLFGNDVKTAALSGYRRYSFKNFQMEKHPSGALLIEQCINGKWYRYIPSEQIPETLVSVKDQFHHWISVDGDPKQIAIQNPAFETQYVGEETSQGFQLHSADKPHLTLQLPAELPLAHFEEPLWIHTWVNKDNAIEALEMPRYHLHFDLLRTTKGFRLASREYPGYHVAPDQELPQLQMVPQYILLENAQGEKKLLIPIKEDSADRKGMNIVACDFDATGQPILQNRRQALHLAYLALIYKDYPLAHRWIDQARTLGGNSLENEITRILQIQDYHPQALSAQLKTALFGFNLKQEPPALKKLGEIYRCYHKADQNAGAWALKVEDEKRLLQELFRLQLLEDEEFERLIALQTRQALKYPLRRPPLFDATGTTLEKKDEWISAFSKLSDWARAQWHAPNSLWNGKQNVCNAPLTRLGVEYVPYFLFLCLCIKQGPANGDVDQEYYMDAARKAEAVDRLRFLKWSTKPQAIALRKMMEDVLENPETYRDQIDKLNFGMKPTEVATWLGAMGELYRHRNPPIRQKAKPWHPPEALPLAMPSPQQMHLLPRGNAAPPPLFYKGRAAASYFEEVQTPIGKEIPNLKPGEDPFVNKQIDLFNQAKKSFYDRNKVVLRHKLKNAAELKEDLEQSLAMEKGMLQRDGERLLERANKILPGQEIEFEGGLRKKLEWRDLYLLYLRGDREAIFKMCPGIRSEEEATRFLKDMTAYLLRQTVQQQRMRCLKAIESEDNDQLYALMTAKREYSIEQYPEYLLFEAMTDKLLRSDQVDVLAKLLAHGADSEKVLQLIMGAGKTKILLPLLALMNADGNNLSLVVVPSSHYETNCEDLSRTSVSAFGQEPIRFQFDRNSPTSEEELTHKLWLLQSAVINRTYVITTAESLLALKLKYQEILFQCKEGRMSREEAAVKLERMGAILSLLKSRGRAVLDETDSLLDVRKMMNFPLGKMQSLPKERFELVKELYRVLLESKHTYIREKKPEAFRKATYLEHVAPQLADAVIRMYNLAPTDFKDYLLGKYTGGNVPGLEQHPQRAEIALAKELITTLLPLMLKKQKELYGLSKESNKRYPIPHKANDDPIESAEFGNVYETLLLAANFYAREDLKDVHLDAILENIRRDIRSESKEHSIPYQETVTCKRFVSLFQVSNPFAVTQQDRATMRQSIRSNHETLFYWLTNFVYPEILTASKKLNGNAYTLVDMLGHVQGFTGTPWNRSTFHQRLQKAQEAHVYSDSEFQVLHAIFEKTEDTGVTPVASSQPKELLHQLINTMQFDAVIDVSALLHGLSNEEVVEYLKKNRKGAIYFNENNELVIRVEKLEPQPLESVTLPLPDVSSYYDQKHTYGTDIKQMPKASALLTFNNTLRDLVQGAMRMRQLLSSQGLQIIIPCDILDQIPHHAGKVAIADLFHYALRKQTERLGDDRVRAARMQMHHLIRQKVEGYLENKPLETQLKLLDTLGQFLMDTIDDDPFHACGTPYALEDSIKVLLEFRDEQIRQVTQALGKNAELNQLLQEIVVGLKAFPLPAKEEVPPLIPREKLNANETLMEVERLVDYEVKVEDELENRQPQSYTAWWTKESGKIHFSDPLFFTPRPREEGKHRPDINGISALIAQGRYNTFQRLFHSSLYTTRHFAETLRMQPEPILGIGSQKKAWQMLFVVEPNGEAKAILVDPVEAACFRKYMKKDAVDKRKIILFDFGSGVIEKKGSPLSTTEEELLEKYRVQAMFFNGETSYLKQEQAMLQKWLQGDLRSLAKQYLEHLRAVHPGLSERYAGSWLKTFLEQ